LDSQKGSTQVAKIPEILHSFLPLELEGKEYYVLNSEKGQSPSASEVKQLNELKVKLTGKISDAMKAYAKENTKNFMKFSGIKYADFSGEKKIVFLYGTKMNDSEYKAMVRSLGSKLLADKEFILALKEYSIKYLTTSGSIGNTSDIEKVKAFFDSAEPNMLSNFNAYMDKLKDIQIIGDNGITASFAVDMKGHVIEQKGSFDIEVDLAKLSALPETAEALKAQKGIVKISFDYTTKAFSINKDIKIDMPLINENNSINLNILSGK
jgi:hypothetical protein